MGGETEIQQHQVKKVGRNYYVSGGGGGAFVTLVFAKEEWQNWDGGRSVGNDRPVVKISCLFFDNAT